MSERADIQNRHSLNMDNFDKQILTLSTFALTFSVTFIEKAIPVPLKEAKIKECLTFSWYLFVVAIVVTVVSFLVSQKGLLARDKHNRMYYVEKDETYFNRKNWWLESVETMALLAGISFCLAVLLLCIFVTSNMP